MITQNGLVGKSAVPSIDQSWEGRIAEGEKAMRNQEQTSCVCPNCGAEAPAGHARCNECGQATVQKAKRIVEQATTRVFRL